MRARTAPPGVRPKEISGPSSRVTTFCCLLALATSALAENSWTLWMIDASSPWDSIGTFSTRELCMEALHRQIQAVEKLGRKVSEDAAAGSSSQPVLTGTFAGSAWPTPTTRVGRKANRP
jgi:hypothetical protein